jgi:hypothetical protein
LVRPVNNDYGWHLGEILDPFGHHWEIGEPLTREPEFLSIISPTSVLKSLFTVIYLGLGEALFLGAPLPLSEGMETAIRLPGLPQGLLDCAREEIE